jgi:hypothetical protein
MQVDEPGYEDQGWDEYDEEEIKRVYDSLMNRSLAIQEAAVALKIHFLS